MKRWVLVVILIVLALTITFMVIYIPPLFNQKSENDETGETTVPHDVFDENFEGYSAGTPMAVGIGRPSPSGAGTWYVMNEGTGIYGDTIFHANPSDDPTFQGQICGNIQKWNAVTSYWANFIYTPTHVQANSSSGSMGFDINIRTGLVNGNGFVIGWSFYDTANTFSNGIMKICITPGNKIFVNRGIGDVNGVELGVILLHKTTHSIVFTEITATTFSVSVDGGVFDNDGNGYPTMGLTNHVIGEFIWTWSVATTGQIDIDNIWTSWNQD